MERHRFLLTVLWWFSLPIANFAETPPSPDDHPCAPKGEPPNICAVWNTETCAWEGTPFKNACDEDVCEEPDPKLSACCKSSSSEKGVLYNPDVITTSSEENSGESIWPGAVGEFISWATTLESKVSLSKKQTQSVGKICCGGVVRTQEIIRSTTKGKTSTEVDLSAVPNIKIALAAATKTAEAAIETISPNRIKTDFDVKLPAHFTLGVDGEGTIRTDCNGTACAGRSNIYTTGSAGGVGTIKLKAYNKAEEVIWEGEVVKLIPAGSITSSRLSYINDDCTEEMLNSDSGCVSVIVSLPFIGKKYTLVEFGKCDE